MVEDSADFYLSKSEPNKSCLLGLREIILAFDEDITETVKYGMPCFCYRNKALVYLWTDKKTKEPYILFVDGQLMDHPMLEAGERARMKVLRVNPNEDFSVELIQEVLRMAVQLQAKV